MFYHGHRLSSVEAKIPSQSRVGTPELSEKCQSRSGSEYPDPTRNIPIPFHNTADNQGTNSLSPMRIILKEIFDFLIIVKRPKRKQKDMCKVFTENIKNNFYLLKKSCSLF